ncbi:hypothetical protein TTHERM_000355919 (macronuclear) [Tetrahymena thermophila SB210]|uniref:Uncharacterized protein n=1 Tax=Tetrahymena thermophila (strain SB210) TaxID=312017 RepID=W7XKX3_TETTS|nr:hypothetical protein TTHERM_000355919 [Tetrahymena thermophila SB210]EWS75289.1 hypothetical protein TTHERM_000355919 [Tetrahymena thermophila SB210]|eukprot:XP_012652280.1 hypothetical protein TTHERM_000355919 [Tetrahymena thermophila SB210]
MPTKSSWQNLNKNNKISSKKRESQLSLSEIPLLLFLLTHHLTQMKSPFPAVDHFHLLLVPTDSLLAAVSQTEENKTKSSLFEKTCKSKSKQIDNDFLNEQNTAIQNQLKHLLQSKINKQINKQINDLTKIS